MNASDPVSGQAEHLCEVPADDDRAVRLDRDGLHGGVGPGPDIEQIIQGPVRPEAGEAITADAVEAGELAADGDFPVGLHGQGKNRSIGAGARIERGVGQPVRQKPAQIIPVGPIHIQEISANDDAAAGLNGQGVHARAGTLGWIEGGIRETVRVDPGDEIAVVAVDAAETAPEQDFAIRLNRQRIDRVVRGGDKGVIEPSIRMQPGQVATVHTVDLGEVARDDHFAIGLKSDRSN